MMTKIIDIAYPKPNIRPELLPCPFCGHDVELKRFCINPEPFSVINTDLHFWHIYCPGCKAMIQYLNDSKKDTINMWNTRSEVLLYNKYAYDRNKIGNEHFYETIEYEYEICSHCAGTGSLQRYEHEITSTSSTYYRTCPICNGKGCILKTEKICRKSK